MKGIVTPPLLLWLILIFVQAPAHSEEKPQGEVARPQSALTKAIMQVSPSVVQIGVTFSHYPARTAELLQKIPDPVWQRGSICQSPCVFFDYLVGTGFFVNDDAYVITAKHVIDAINDFKVLDEHREPLDLGQRMPSVRIQTANLGEIGPEGFALPPGPTTRGTFESTVFEKIDEDPYHDLALLKLKYNPFKVDSVVMETPKGPVKMIHVRSATFSLARPDEGEPIAVSGYPLRSPVLVTTSGAIASSWEVDQKQLPTGFRISDAYLADMHVNHGDSGGPIYSLADGSVIGVCVSIVPDTLGNNLFYNSGLSFVVPAKYVVELLRKNHLKWTEKMPSP